MSETNGNTNKIDYDLVSATIRDLFKKFLLENGITDPKIEIQPGSMRGDNYLGIIAKATVTGKDKTGKSIQESYIIKSAPKSEGLRKFAPIAFAYEREIYVYSNVLPAFKKFQEEFNIKNPFNSYAQCYKTSINNNDEALILKDMKELGYKMKNRLFALDYNHIKLVMTELAKLHALSFALRDHNPELFLKFSEDMKKNYFKEMDFSAFEASIDIQCDKALETLDPETDAKAIEQFNKFRPFYVSSLVDCLEDSYHPYSVIRHGDCWTNNILFKYDENLDPKKPTSICFLDWQLTHVGPPVLDLFYFIYACSDQPLREKHFDQLIKDYYEVLRERTAEFGSDIEKLYPFSVLQEQLQTFGRYGMSIGIMLLQFLLNDPDEIPDMNTIFDEVEPEKIMEQFGVMKKNKDIFTSRMRGVILHCVEKKFI